MIRRWALGRPSAALVLGVLSGLVAAVALLPTIIPVSDRLRIAAEAVALRQAAYAAREAENDIDDGLAVTSATLERLRVDLIEVFVEDGQPVYAANEAVSESAFARACRSPNLEVVVPGAEGADWALACRKLRGVSIVAGMEVERNSRRQVVGLIAVLAALVGVITSVVVLRVLSPLSDISRALSRLANGERNVVVPRSGLVELDALAERVQATAEAFASRQDALAARIQVVQEMARVVAHEVRNPLQALEFHTSLIALEEDPVERRKIAGGIGEEIRNLEQVVRRLLRNGATGGALQLARRSQPLGHVVSQVVGVLQASARQRSISLTTGDLSRRVVSTDRAFLSRAIENLVQNALQTVPMQTGVVVVTTDESDGHIAIHVDDNGDGVDPSIVDAIFDTQVTTKIDGSGIGLILVRGVVEAHGGYVRHGPSKLGGARFSIHLPLDGPEDPRGTPNTADPRRR